MADSSHLTKPAYANNSGTGGDPPPEVLSMGFNWGAFLLHWIWGIANGVWNSLLVFVLGLVWMVVLGLKGNEWAWRARKFDSIEQFRETQAAWSRWGIILLVFSLVVGLLVVALVIGGAILAGELRPPIGD